MEMIIGQFSSRGSVKVYDCAPAMRGNFRTSFKINPCKFCTFLNHIPKIIQIESHLNPKTLKGVGYGQVLSIAIVSTYYASLMATTLKYLFESFQKILPWATCDDSWAGFCIPSGNAALHRPANGTIASNVTSVVQMSSSAELYYK